jgi:hypothetical protein
VNCLSSRQAYLTDRRTEYGELNGGWVHVVEEQVIGAIAVDQQRSQQRVAGGGQKYCETDAFWYT